MITPTPMSKPAEKLVEKICHSLSVLLLCSLLACDQAPPRSAAEKGHEHNRLSGQLVTAAEFRGAWPFTVEQGYVDCVPYQAAVFRVGGSIYALNGLAQSKYPKIDPIWKANPEIPGTRINIGPMIDLALARCK